MRPRLGMTVGSLRNEDQVKAMPGGAFGASPCRCAVAVVAERWWHAKRAVGVDFRSTGWSLRADFESTRDAGRTFSSDEHFKRPRCRKPARPGMMKTRVDVAGHAGQCQDQGRGHVPHKPVSATIAPAWSRLRRWRIFNADGSLEIWLPNQAQDMFPGRYRQGALGLAPERITLHSPLLGRVFFRTAFPV